MPMQSPVVALLWECWRLSRRWYLWVLPVAIAANLALMNVKPRVTAGPQAGNLIFDGTLAYQFMAPSAFIVNFSLALITTQLAITMGGRAGFPLGFEFRLPVRTSVLVAVPVLYLAAICASLYVVPMLLSRLVFDVRFPLLPASALLATLVVALLASGWGTTSTSSRSVAMVATLFGSLQLFRWLDPLHLPQSTAGRLPLFTPDVLVLTPTEYGLLAMLCLLLFGLLLASIRRQRCGEAPTVWLTQVLGPWRQAADGSGRVASSWSIDLLLDWMADLFTLPCPVQSPWRAELWLELKRHVLPILLCGVLLALLVPVLFMLGITPAGTGVSSFDYLFPTAVFLAGIGIAVFNRRLATAGYLGAFEGTRGMGTLKLMLIQLLAVAVSTLVGIVLVCASVYVCSQFLDVPGSLARRLLGIGAALSEHGALLLLSESFTLLVVYLGMLTLFACLHACSVVWGRIFPYGTAVVAFYGIIFTFRVAIGAAELDTIEQHMWGFAVAVLLVALLALGFTLRLRLLAPRAGLAVVLCWGIFLASSLYTLSHRGIALPEQPSELQAFNAALLLLPLLVFMLLTLSYDRLRHR